MKSIAGILAAACLLLSAPAPASAAHFKKGRRLPTPIDYPIVRKRLRDDHKAGKRSGQHEARYLWYGWGSLKRQVFTIPPSHFGQHFFYDTDR